MIRFLLLPSFSHDAASVNSGNATTFSADSFSIYRVIQVRLLALVVDKIIHARRISTVPTRMVSRLWERVRIEHGKTRRVLSL